MKKHIAWILVIAMMAAALAGCQNNAAPSPTPGQSAAPTEAGDPAETPTAEPAEPPAETPTEEPNTPGEHVLADFRTVVQGMGSPTPREIAEAMLDTEYIRNKGFFVSDIDAGSYAAGIRDLGALSFAGCACFAPEMGPSACIGYVFQLEEGADMDAFLQTLHAQADPGYEVCMMADEVITGSAGSYALLFMCTANFAPIEMEDTPGQHVADAFQSMVQNLGNPTARAVAEAMLDTEYIVNKGFRVTDIQAGDRMPGITDPSALSFAEGACFAPEMSPSACIGYVFLLEDSADIDVFQETLNAQADPWWEVCMGADEVITASEGSYVMLFMCPAGFAPVTEAIDYRTPGTRVLDDFCSLVRGFENPTARAVAEALMETDYFRGKGFLVSDVSAGDPIPGLKEAESLTYGACANFAPEIGPSAVTGAVFQLEDGADPNVLVDSLYSMCDPGFAVCVWADEVVAGAEGNYVLYFLCTADFAPLDE